MASSKTASLVITIRVPARLKRDLAREARRRRQTRSELVRTILEERYGQAKEVELADEARRQSVLVSRRHSESDALASNGTVGAPRGWT
jgi:metal-responsive CopG/Arc/MetJ family transcriptional regulator